MSVKFNLSKLGPVFHEALSRHDPSVIFSVELEGGRFVFLLFMSTDSDGKIQMDKQELLVFLANTQQLLELKLYGNLKKTGNYFIYLTEQDEKKIRAELGIVGVEGPAFDIISYWEKLNNLIPDTISVEEKITVVRNNPAIQQQFKKFVDDATKVYLIGTRALPEGKVPRDETLRKLYMLNEPPATIAKLIANLKRINWTVCWTDEKPGTDKFAEIFEKVAKSE